MINLPDNLVKWIEDLYSKTETKIAKNAVSLHNIIPNMVDENGKYQDTRTKKEFNGVNCWTNGFYGGILWLLYQYTNKDIYKDAAINQLTMLDEALHNYDMLDHDVGFLWNLAARPHYTLEGDKESRYRTMIAANVLSARANIKGKYIKAWNRPNYSIIDCMMNIPLLYWASREIGDDRFKYVAMMHADSTIKHHIRDDGSVVHIAHHYTDRDELIETLAGQGCAVGSSWTRGQAWAVYGFVLSYIHTKEQRYFDISVKIIDKFISEAEKFNWRIPCDFKQDKSCTYLDNSAALCAVCGIIELAKITDDNKYLDAALNILKALEKDLDFSEDNQSIVQNCMISYSMGTQVDLIYADFFLVEALLKLKGSDFLIW